jgi:hypothetical protein
MSDSRELPEETLRLLLRARCGAIAAFLAALCCAALWGAR